MSNSTGTFRSGLGEFCKVELLGNWVTMRKDVEIKWKNNEDAFNSVVTGDLWKKEETADWRSDTFISQTKMKVLAAYSMIIDMLLQRGQLPFDLVLSPWDLVVMEELPPDQQEALKDNVNDMKSLIHQQVLDCKGDREIMKCVMASAKLGETYWKSYIHEVTRRGFNTVDFQGGDFKDQRFEPFETTIDANAFKYVSCWDIYRDMETDDMQNSQGYCERSWNSPYGLRELKGEPHYFDDAIDRVIKEHLRAASKTTSSDSQTPARRKIKNPYNHIQQWEFWCRVPRKILETFEKDKDKDREASIQDIEKDGDEVEVTITMAEEEIIRLVRIKPESRAHGRVVWEINLDDNHGIGVSDNVQHVQKALVGMVRAFEDNKKLSANVMAAIKKAYIEDWDGEFKPGELFGITDDCDDARQAIAQIIFQDVGDSLLLGIALMERYGDDLSNIPRIQQGSVAPKQKPDTLGEINILQSNSGKYFGSVTMNFDDGLIEPIVSRFLEYNMLDPEVKKGKGNYIAKPLGFQTFQDKIIRLQKTLQAINLTLASPSIERETKLKVLLEAAYKSLDIDPQTIFKTKDELEAYDQAMSQAQQAAGDQKGMEILAKVKAEMEKSLAEIEAKHKAKLIEMEAEHQDKLAEMDEEWDNKQVEGKKEEA